MFNRSSILTNILKTQVVKTAKINAAGRGSRQKINFSPSMDFMCPTKTYYNFKYSGGNYMDIEDEEITYENERAKEIGNQFHTYVEQMLKSSGALRLSEITMEDPEHHIRARLDCVIEHNKELYLVELKTAKSYSVKLMNDDSAPDMEHQKQIQLYFHLYEVCKNDPEIFEICQGRPLTKGILFYENKNDQKPLEFYVPKHQGVINECLGFADKIWKNIKDGETPKFRFGPDASECLYKCRPQFYELCYGKNKPVKEKLVDPGLWGFAEARINNGEKFV